MSNKTKRGYKNALRNQLDDIKDVAGEDFPETGIITFSYNIETGESVSTISGGISTQDDNGDGGTGGKFP
jgi:hypothetical protein